MKTILKMEYYTKGNNNNWYCDYYMYNYNNSEQGTTKATGYGYDKQSTCVSKAINIYKNLYKRYGKNAKKYTSYGLDKNNTISYGIGINAVINCIKCFKNVKIINYIELNHTGYIELEINTESEGK